VTMISMFMRGLQCKYHGQLCSTNALVGAFLFAGRGLYSVLKLCQLAL
jgi:hypothetical protein